MYAKGDYLKVEFRDEQSGESEWMWVQVESDDPALRVVFGTLDSEPLVCTDLRLGQQIAVGYDTIRDHRTPASFKPVSRPTCLSCSPSASGTILWAGRPQARTPPARKPMQRCSRTRRSVRANHK